MTIPQFGQNIVRVDLDVITNALGALDDAAASGDPTNVDTAMAYLKQIINTLEGTVGIPVFPAAADPANGVSLAEVIRRIFDKEALAAYIGPRGLGVWLDDAAANVNTVLGTDGTADNPVSTIAAALTLVASLGSNRIYLINDTDITLAATMEDFEFIGIGEFSANSIDLGGQDVDRSAFYNLLLTGIQGGAERMQAIECDLLNVSGLQVTAFRCGIGGTLTVRASCFFDACFSVSAGGTTPVVDINSVANVFINWRHYSGGLQVDKAVATTVMSFEAIGQLIIDASCTDLTISVRGTVAITDNGVTTALTQEAAINLTNIIAVTLQIEEVVIYPVAEHEGTTELIDDGADPAFSADTVQTTAAAVSEATAEAAWLEAINFEQAGTIEIIGIFALFEWHTRFVNNAGAGTNSVSKIQMSTDGGATWVDMTDNFTNPAVAYTVRLRAGVGRWLPTIVAGADQLQFRLVQWSDDAGGVDRSDAEIRVNSYVRITYRKAR